MLHTIVALVRDRPGVLNRAVSLFRRRAINVDSLTVGSTEHPARSRMTLVVGHDNVQLLVRQLERLIDVISVHDITSQRPVEREMCLVRVTASGPQHVELATIARAYSASIVALTATAAIVCAMDAPATISALVERLRCPPFAIEEMVRSGRIAMTVDTAISAPATDFIRATRPSNNGHSHPFPTQWQADGAGDYEAT